MDGGAIVAPGLSLDRRTQVRRVLSSECSDSCIRSITMSNDENASTGGDKTWPCARDAGLLAPSCLGSGCRLLVIAQRAELSNASAATAAESMGLGGPT